MEFKLKMEVRELNLSDLRVWTSSGWCKQDNKRGIS